MTNTLANASEQRNLGSQRQLSVRSGGRWKERSGDVIIVPYTIDGAFDSEDEQLIVEAINQLAEDSGVVKFVRRTSSHRAYIHVKTGLGCSSWVGRVTSGTVQDLILAKPSARSSGTCVSFGIIQHAFLHALGFYHEQSRADRDNYVTINMENVSSKARHNFDIERGSDALEGEYDYDSVMHYKATDFLDRGLVGQNLKTIQVPPGIDEDRIGQRDGASDQDIIEVRLLYQCLTGPRRLSDYQADLCTSDCKCWEGAVGCNGNDDACQGDLTCNGNTCGADTSGPDGGTSGPDGGTASDIGTPYYISSPESPSLCLSVRSTTDGTPVSMEPCDQTAGQVWYRSPNKYTRNGLDANKCLVGSAGATTLGTRLMINSCFANDGRFVWEFYTDDSYRPLNNPEVCITQAFFPPRLELSTCNSADEGEGTGPGFASRRQKWIFYTVAEGGQRKLQEEECSDSPLGWYDFFGDNCEWYAESTNCIDYGSGKMNFGVTANQACCACGGGSTAQGAEDDLVLSDPVDDASISCWDSPSGWYDSVGDDCAWYAQGDYCEYYGRAGSDFASGGLTAADVCCACGGGSPERPPAASSSLSDVPPGCSDSPSRWNDENNDGCEWYAEDDNCNEFGDEVGNYGKTAKEACCACGGGSIPSNDRRTDNGSTAPTTAPTDNAGDSAGPTAAPTDSPRDTPGPTEGIDLGNIGDTENSSPGGASLHGALYCLVAAMSIGVSLVAPARF